jgi:hypothetical protein
LTFPPERDLLLGLGFGLALASSTSAQLLGGRFHRRLTRGTHLGAVGDLARHKLLTGALGRARIERGPWVVLDAELDGLCRLLPGCLTDNGQGEVDPRRHSASGDEVAVDHDALLDRRGPKGREQVMRGPMRGGAPALQKARRAPAPGFRCRRR